MVLVHEARVALIGDVVLGGGGDPEPTDASGGCVGGQQDDRSLPSTRNVRHVAAYIPWHRRRIRGYQGRDVTSHTLDRVANRTHGIDHRRPSLTASQSEPKGTGKTHPTVTYPLGCHHPGRHRTAACPVRIFCDPPGSLRLQERPFRDLHSSRCVRLLAGRRDLDGSLPTPLKLPVAQSHLHHWQFLSVGGAARTTGILTPSWITYGNSNAVMATGDQNPDPSAANTFTHITSTPTSTLPREQAECPPPP